MLKPFANVTYKDGLGIGKLQRPGGGSLVLFNALHECLISNIDLHSTGRLLAILTLFSFCVGVAGLIAMCMLVMLCPTPKCAWASLRNCGKFFSEMAIDILHLDVFWVAVVLVHGNANALAQTMRAEKMMSASQVGKLQAGR